MSEAYIYDVVRTPRGKGKNTGSLHEITALSLSSQILEALRDRNSLDTSLVDDVIWGCVTPIGEQGADIARTAVLMADYAETTAGVQINRFCASGLEAVNMAAAKVIAGEADFAIGGGVECMSRIPMGSDGGAWPTDPSVAIKTRFVPQGISADAIATKYGISRDDCDAYAVQSQQRSAQSWADGRFKRSILPIKDQLGSVILDYDETIRGDASMQSLGSLDASFKMMGEVMPGFDAVILQRYPELEKINHVHHAGNSSGIVDGSAGVLIGSKEAGERAGLKPRAKIMDALLQPRNVEGFDPPAEVTIGPQIFLALGSVQETLTSGVVTAPATDIVITVRKADGSVNPAVSIDVDPGPFDLSFATTEGFTGNTTNASGQCRVTLSHNIPSPLFQRRARGTVTATLGQIERSLSVSL